MIVLSIGQPPFGQVLENGRFVKFVYPDYPRAAQVAHVEDVVVLEPRIDKRGIPGKIQAIKGQSLFANAAMAAAHD